MSEPDPHAVFNRYNYGRVTLHNGKVRHEHRGPVDEAKRPVISSAPVTGGGLVCHNCLKPTARPRAGAEYDGQYLCNNCGTVFVPTFTP